MRTTLTATGTMLVAFALAAPMHAAGAWSTAAVATHRSDSENGSMTLRLGTTLSSVSALRLRATVQGSPLETSVSTRCKRGAQRADRRIAVTLRAGTGIYALPLPLKGGSCSVDVVARASDRGAVTLKLQYQR
jgi:hypothetical protein